MESVSTTATLFNLNNSNTFFYECQDSTIANTSFNSYVLPKVSKPSKQWHSGKSATSWVTGRLFTNET